MMPHAYHIADNGCVFCIYTMLFRLIEAGLRVRNAKEPAPLYSEAGIYITQCASSTPADSAVACPELRPPKLGWNFSKCLKELVAPVQIYRQIMAWKTHS